MTTDITTNTHSFSAHNSIKVDETNKELHFVMKFNNHYALLQTLDVINEHIKKSNHFYVRFGDPNSQWNIHWENMP